MRTPRKLLRSSASAAVLALVAISLIAAPVFAAKHGGGGATTGSSSLTMSVSVDANSDGLPNWSDSVTYQVSTTATTTPYVSTQCTQNGVLVLSTSAGFYASYAWPGAQVVPLATPMWTGGGADCTAKLYYATRRSTTVLKTITFHVGA